MANSEEHDWNLVCPFYIDTATYTDKQRLMFCCGYEFCQILTHIRFEENELKCTIHKENESRIRMACGRFQRKCTIENVEDKYDPLLQWSYLYIEGKS